MKARYKNILLKNPKESIIRSVNRANAAHLGLASPPSRRFALHRHPRFFSRLEDSFKGSKSVFPEI